MFGKAINDLIRGLSLWRVWTYQAWHEMTIKYKRTFLGSFWLAGSMVVTSLCLALVWGALMGRNMHEILPYIAGGILCFDLVGSVFYQGPELFLSAGRMIKNHPYPFTYYVLETLCRNVFTFSHNVLIFFVVTILVQNPHIPHWTFILGFPVVLISVATWGTVVGLIAARFRDLRFMLPYIGQLLFYVTPIIWRVDDISSKRAFIAHFNPLYGLLDVLRAPLLGHAATPQAWYLAMGTMISGIIVWLMVFPPFRKKIPFWI